MQVVAHVEVAEQRLGTSEGADRVVGILSFRMEEHHVFLFLCSIKLVCASCDVANGCAKQQIVHNEKVFVGDRIVSVS